MKNMMLRMVTGFVLIFSGLMSSGAWAYEMAGVDIHGFVSQGFIYSEHFNYLTNDSKDGSFQYNELGINFGKELTENLRLGIQLFSRDVGDAGNNKITIDWAYGDYHLRDWLGVRAGRIKLPIGLYNETRDIDMLRTNIIMPQSLYQDLLRDTVIAANGAGVYGNIDMSGAGSLDYQVVAGQLNIDNDSGFEKYFNHRAWGLFSVSGDSDSEITFAGSLKWNTPLDGLLLGVSAMRSPLETPISYIMTGHPLAGTPGRVEATNRVYTLSMEYTWEDLVIAAEWQQFEQDYEAHSDAMGAVVRAQNDISRGYYIQASYRFTELFSLGAYYSVFYPDKDDKDGTNNTFKSDAWEKDYALTMRFDINEYCIFKVEGHYVDGTARVLTQDNTDRTRDDFTYGVAKVTFSF